jgi:hypothetical protein
MSLRRVTVAVSAAVLVAISGCDPADETSAEQPAESRPASSPPSSPPSAESAPMTADSEGGLTLASFAATTSQAQVRARTAHLHAEVDMQGQRADLSGDLTLAESLAETSFAIEVSAPGLGGDVELILVDNMLYQRNGGAAEGRYLTLDLDDRSNPLGAFYTQMLGQSDPAGITRALEGAIEDFRPVGAARLDGVATTRYRVTVDSRKVLTRLLGADLMAAQSVHGPFPETLTYDIWVGADDNLPRRMAYAVMGSTVVMDLTDWGEPVRIQAPPEGQISDDPLVTVPTAPEP